MTSLGAALYYVARGWPVLPLWPVIPRHGRDGFVCLCREGDACDWPGKHPACAGGASAATCDVARVERFWQAFEARWYTSPSVGIATGGSLVVVDIDAPKTGDETWRRIAETHPRLDTVEVLTGRGRHLYFDARGFGRVPSSVGRLGAGVDVRGSGGYVVAPPSRHESGRRYVFEAASDPTEGASLVALPDWLVALAREPSRVSPARFAVGETIPAGQRNETLARFACSLRARGIEEPELREAVEHLNASACDPPLSAREVETIVRGVLRRYRAGLSARVLAALRASEAAERAAGRYDFKSDPAWWLASTGGEVPADPDREVARG